GFAAAGWPVRVATDAPCANAVAAALRGAGAAPAVGLDIVAGEGDVAASIAAVAAGWRAAGITHAIAIERCGRAADGAPYNMRGISVAGVTAPLDDLFTGGPWTRIGIGDGGNEVGMGKLPAALIAASVPNGAKIACVTPADHLVVCGVSNWGAYGLLTAMAALRPDLAPALRSTLTGAADRRILDTLVRDGPAGDPVAGARAASVDGYPHEVHAEVIARLDAALSS
ncbi:MAG: DUF4392 domain-containing protein, partial [Rhodospirillales bacterium]|nr:DUF4392 domain-containing protein [Rhodospirillales bacterium]